MSSLVCQIFLWIIFSVNIFATTTNILDANLTSETSGTQFLLDARQFRTKRSWQNQYLIKENLPISPNQKHKISSFRSSKHSDDVRYSIIGEGANTLFEIDRLNGDLFAVQSFDREVKSSYHLSVFAKSLQGSDVEDPATVSIIVEDENDNPPVFYSKVINASIPEHSALGTSVITMQATDEDDPSYNSNGKIEYSIKNSNSSNFQINSTTGNIFTTSINLDFETIREYELVVQAKDAPGYEEYHSASTTLFIRLTDLNDNPPLFKQQSYLQVISENAAIGSEVLCLNIADKDQGRNTETKFSAVDEDFDTFEINQNHSKVCLTLNAPLDYEALAHSNHSLTFTLEARNLIEDLKFGPMYSTTKITAKIIDVNEFPDFNNIVYKFSVNENAEIGLSIGKITAIDPEEDYFEYWFLKNTDSFQIDPITGNIAVQRTLDRESTEFYNLTVAAGKRDFFNTVPLTVEVIDVNDNPPVPVNYEDLNRIICFNKEKDLEKISDIKINMEDKDSLLNSLPLHFHKIQSSNTENHFQLSKYEGDSVSFQLTLNNLDEIEYNEYSQRFLVEDNGNPRLNATYELKVRVCHCNEISPISCDEASRSRRTNNNAMYIFFGVCLSLLIASVCLIFTTRRKKSETVLMKHNESHSENGMMESITDYREEGKEKDTRAFNVSILRRTPNASNTSSRHAISSSGNQLNAVYPYVPSMIPTYRSLCRNTNVTLPCRHRSDSSGMFPYETHGRRMNHSNNFCALPHDSMQIYAYEGRNSTAGSLSSICSSTDDDQQDYSFLKNYRPRFKRLAQMYNTS